MRAWPFAATDFAHSRLVLSSARTLRRRSRGVAAAITAFAAGAALAFFYEAQHVSVPPQPQAASQELPPLRAELEQSRLQLRVAEARGQELEHQIDTLNQQLRASQEELTFFRKTRDAKR
jgi:uncharacterized protein HemX